jgi:hypothetical protein
MSEAPPAYYEILSEAPPAYSDASVDLAAQLEQMKATMKLEKGNMMWKMHLQKEEMIEKMEQMRLEKEAMMEQMRLKMEKRICEEKERVKTEKKVFVAKEKHWSSDFDSWYKKCSMIPAIKQRLHSIVSAFLKTIPTETIYAIHSITLKNYGDGSNGYCRPHQYSQGQLYIATCSKVYTLDYNGDINGNYQFPSPSVFRASVTFPSEPTPTFWRAIFSQIEQEDIEFTVSGQGNIANIYHRATAKLEALFKSFR